MLSKRTGEDRNSKNDHVNDHGAVLATLCFQMPRALPIDARMQLSPFRLIVPRSTYNP